MPKAKQEPTACANRNCLKSGSHLPATSRSRSRSRTAASSVPLISAGRSQISICRGWARRRAVMGACSAKRDASRYVEPFANHLSLELTPLVRREPAMRRVCSIPRRVQSAECFAVRARADGVQYSVRELTSREHARASQWAFCITRASNGGLRQVPSHTYHPV
jgi:hypothetical protein